MACGPIWCRSSSGPNPWPRPLWRKRGQAPFAGTARRVLRTKGACPLFRLFRWPASDSCWPARSRGRDVLAQQLTTAGAKVDEIVVYASTDVEQPDGEVAAMLRAGRVDWVTVTSSAIGARWHDCSATTSAAPSWRASARSPAAFSANWVTNRRRRRSSIRWPD